MGMTRNLFKKIRDTKGTFHAKMGSIKDRNSMDLTEAGKVVGYSHLFKNFPQFVVIHTVKGFGMVNKTEVDVLLELLLFQ